MTDLSNDSNLRSEVIPGARTDKGRVANNRSSGLTSNSSQMLAISYGNTEKSFFYNYNRSVHK